MRETERVADIAPVINCKVGVHYQIPNRNERQRGSFCVNCTLQQQEHTPFEKFLYTNKITKKFFKEKPDDVPVAILRDVKRELKRENPRNLLICGASERTCKNVGGFEI